MSRCSQPPGAVASTTWSWSSSSPLVSKLFMLRLGCGIADRWPLLARPAHASILYPCAQRGVCLLWKVALNPQDGAPPNQRSLPKRTSDGQCQTGCANSSLRTRGSQISENIFGLAHHMLDSFLAGRSGTSDPVCAHRQSMHPKRQAVA